MGVAVTGEQAEVVVAVTGEQAEVVVAVTGEQAEVGVAVQACRPPEPGPKPLSEPSPGDMLGHDE